ncbi:hypothetical protein Xaut_3611 [Xanthobacter versatilis]|uniref:Uncharacterized protein n=1 Tax=Xanthobacter autotrophicus (strain ATCC BAA-1158 / Py2) TaxID=78245 RepID=A7ILE6_XANP2|nr:hypothetical protein Xaut_3611 [Xanthobacter autotrophicus Py2]
MVDIAEFADAGELSLYFDTKPGQLADLEVVAAAAIQWAQGLKAAASIADPTWEYRVSLVAAKPGSSNWIAKIERSKANDLAQQVVDGWKKVPVIFRLAIGLAVVVPTSAIPTLNYYMGNDGFSETQKRELIEIFEKTSKTDAVKMHRQQMYKEAPRDRKITGIGTGVPTSDDWRPAVTIPSDQFAEADGLFDVRDDKPMARTIPQILDVVLVTPRLENAPKAWTFRQEGIPGTFNAVMKDKKFLAALERSEIHETLRANIPMRVRLQIKQKYIDGEWKVISRGRSVVEVLSPRVD